MEAVNLRVLPREKKGKGYNRRLRDKGQIPAVIYGKGMEDIPITIPERELKEILVRETGRNTIIKINIEGTGDKEDHTVMIRDIQQDPLKGQLLHADFYEISLNKRIHTKVPVTFSGDCLGLRKGGIIQHVTREVEMECLPSEIPEHLDIDITNLDIGQRLTVADLKCNEGCRILTDAETVVVSIIAPRRAEVEDAESDPGVTEPKPAAGEVSA